VDWIKPYRNPGCIAILVTSIESRDGHSFATRRIARLMICTWLRPSTLNGKSDSDISSVSVADKDAKNTRTARTRAS
jgi:hypothetical protein